MNQFMDMIKEIFWWLALIIIFVLFLNYYKFLESLSKITVITIGLLAVVWGASYSLTRYVRLTKSFGRSDEEKNIECIRWTAEADLKYNLLAWTTFIMIIIIGELSSPISSTNDLVQATAAFLALMGGKKMLVKKFFSQY